MLTTPFQKLASASFFVLAGLVLPSCEAIGFLRGQAAVRQAKIAKARLHVTSLVLAVQAFADDYNRLPAIEGGALANDFQTTSGKEFINPLVGLDKKQNPRQAVYFQAAQAVDNKGGLLALEEGKAAELIDPWGNKYHLLLDANYDDELAEPLTGKPLIGRNVLAWSAGPDGKINPDPRHPNNTDNVYSWK